MRVRVRVRAMVRARVRVMARARASVSEEHRVASDGVRVDVAVKHALQPLARLPRAARLGIG